MKAVRRFGVYKVWARGKWVGRLMLFGAALFIIGHIGGPPEATADQRVRAVPIEYRAHLPVIKVLINGEGPFDLVVDTGADLTVLSKAVVEALDIPVVGTMAIGSPMGTSPLQADSLQIRSIQVGDVVIEDMPGVSLELKDMFRSIEAPDGILSAAAFDGFLMTIDFPNNIVAIRKGELSPADGKRVLDYTSDSNVPGIPILVGGVKLTAAMDTGAPSALSMPSEYVSRLPLASEPVVTGSGRTVDATFEIRSATLDGDLTIGQIVIQNPTIVFNDMSRKPNIGMGLLREFAITIDRANHRVAFERSLQAAQSNSQVRRVVRAGGKGGYGIMLPGLSGDALEVTGVEKGLVAAQAGLMKGDRIIAMNGKPVASLSEDERMACLRGSPLVLRVERGSDTLEITLSLE